MNDFYHLKLKVDFDLFEFDPSQNYINNIMMKYLNFSYVAFVAAIMLADASFVL